MVSRKPPGPAELTKEELQELSEFRYQLRRFLHFSEEIVHAEGITPLQYMLLLHIGGFPGRGWASVGELAELTLPLFDEPHNRGSYAAWPCWAASQFFSNVMGLT